MNVRCLFVVCISMVVLLGFGVMAIAALENDPVVVKKAENAIDRGLKFLRAQQKENGSWDDYPGITALVLTAFMQSHRRYTEEDGPFISRGVSFLVDCAKPDGSIYTKDLPAYNTSVCMMALHATGNPKYKPLVEKAQRFLKTLQADEGEGYTKDNKFYGGIGYGGDERPDLSNLQYALEALSETGVAGDDPVWDKALVFVQRCQNRSESNDQAWAGNDGGFVYHPGDSKAGALRSYGSMTYAGLKSFVYARLGKDDPRVKSAIDWARIHYTLDENPGMGPQGLYYYYHTFAKALSMLDDSVLVDDKGGKHRWYEDLVNKLTGEQRDDGSWKNEKSARWWENNPVLLTAYAVLALEQGLK